MLFKSLIAASLASFATASNDTTTTAAAATTAAASNNASVATTAANNNANNNASVATTAAATTSANQVSGGSVKDKWVNSSMSFKIPNFDLGNVTHAQLATAMNSNDAFKDALASSLFSLFTPAEKTDLGVSSAADFHITNIRAALYSRRLEEARQLAVQNTEIEFDYGIKTTQAKGDSLKTHMTTDRTSAFITNYKNTSPVDLKATFGVGANPGASDYAAGSQGTPTTDATAASSSSTTTSSASGLGVSAVALLVACVMSM